MAVSSFRGILRGTNISRQSSRSIDVSHASKIRPLEGGQGTRDKEQGTRELGTRDKEIRERTAAFSRSLRRVEHRVSASRVSRFWGLKIALQSLPTNPPTHSRFLRPGNAKSTGGKRKKRRIWVFASIRNTKGSLGELRNRGLTVRAHSGAS